MWRGGVTTARARELVLALVAAGAFQAAGRGWLFASLQGCYVLGLALACDGTRKHIAWRVLAELQVGCVGAVSGVVVAGPVVGGTKAMLAHLAGIGMASPQGSSCQSCA
jgi:hypothetical protein